MDKSYWNDETKILLDQNEIIALLDYEIDMFKKTCEFCEICSFLDDRVIKNFIVEALATHSRILIDFFYPEERQRKYVNDLKIEDFIPLQTWNSQRPELTQTLFDARKKADKQLAHLSRWRNKLDKDNRKSWQYENISRDLERVIEVFYKLRNLVGEEVMVEAGEIK
jgi:hypothetical protein